MTIRNYPSTARLLPLYESNFDAFNYFGGKIRSHRYPADLIIYPAYHDHNYDIIILVHAVGIAGTNNLAPASNSTRHRYQLQPRVCKYHRR